METTNYNLEKFGKYSGEADIVVTVKNKRISWGERKIWRAKDQTFEEQQNGSPMERGH